MENFFKTLGKIALGGIVVVALLLSHGAALIEERSSRKTKK